MKKTCLILLVALAALLASCADNDPRVIVITYDGLRWQEVYTGADSALVSDPRFVKDIEATKAKYWRDTPEERREALMPFAWNYVAKKGYMLGNRNKNSLMQVANNKSFSYPGYSELFCGWADDERVDSNDPVENPNTSVLEVANKDPRYKGSVMVYASWESIRHAVNNDKGGFPGSAAFEPNVSPNPTPVMRMIDRMQESEFGYKKGDERPDAYTYAYAMETIRNDHPKVLFIGFGGTDGTGHSGDYASYLHSINTTDACIKDIIETCEADPFYKGKTTYILTTDHGRGRGERFTGHGADLRGSNETWFMAFGKGIPALGETSDNGVFYSRQLAATIADILGLDFTPDNGVKSDPIDPEYQSEPEPPTAVASLKAVDAKPKGAGVSYTYHEGDFMSVAEVIASPVRARGTVPFFDLTAKLREDHFGFQFKALMKIDQSGLYQMSLACDDGSKLFIDGRLLFDIDRDGGGFSESWIELEAGYHRIEIQYFENYGGETLEVGLTGPGIDVEQLPSSMLYHE